MRSRTWLVPMVLTLAAGCGGKNGIPGFKNPDGPGIAIDEPHEGDVIQSSSVWLKVHTAGVTFSGDSAGNPTEGGDGSYHVYLDGNAVGETTANTYLVSQMTPGPHEISVRLFGTDGAPISGAHPAKVAFTIPNDAPRMKIVSPSNGATVNSSSVELTLQWQNYASNAWDAFVDSMEAEPSASAESPTWVVSHLTPGEHDVYVRLLWGPNDPVDPPVIDKIHVRIPATAPSIGITSPSSSSTVNRTPQLHVTTQNFTIDGNRAGGTNQAGVGHYHIYLDGYDSSHMWQEGFSEAVTLDNIDVGEHDIYVRLMNNDHTSIDPKIVDWVHVTVTPN